MLHGTELRQAGDEVVLGSFNIDLQHDPIIRPHVLGDPCNNLAVSSGERRQLLQAERRLYDVGHWDGNLDLATLNGIWGLGCSTNASWQQAEPCTCPIWHEATCLPDTSDIMLDPQWL